MVTANPDCTHYIKKHECSMGRKRCTGMSCKDFNATPEARKEFVKLGYKKYVDEAENEENSSKDTHTSTIKITGVDIVRKSGFIKFRDAEGTLHKVENGKEYKWGKSGRAWSYIGESTLK